MQGKNHASFFDLSKTLTNLKPIKANLRNEPIEVAGLLSQWNDALDAAADGGKLQPAILDWSGPLSLSPLAGTGVGYARS